MQIVKNSLVLYNYCCNVILCVFWVVMIGFFKTFLLGVILDAQQSNFWW